MQFRARARARARGALTARRRRERHQNAPEPPRIEPYHQPKNPKPASAELAPRGRAEGGRVPRRSPCFHRLERRPARAEPRPRRPPLIGSSARTQTPAGRSVKTHASPARGAAGRPRGGVRTRTWRPAVLWRACACVSVRVCACVCVCDCVCAVCKHRCVPAGAGRGWDGGTRAYEPASHCQAGEEHALLRAGSGWLGRSGHARRAHARAAPRPPVTCACARVGVCVCVRRHGRGHSSLQRQPLSQLACLCHQHTAGRRQHGGGPEAVGPTPHRFRFDLRKTESYELP